MKVIIALLLFVISFVISFAITFTLINLYVFKQRKPDKKYSFSTPVPEPNIKLENEMISTSSVDAESAHKEWQRKNNQQF